jgi:GTP cyclohydrolase I
MNTKERALRGAIEDGVRTVLGILGVDLDSEMYRETPTRVATMALEFLSGMDKENEPKLTLFKNTGYRDILILKRIPFYSICAHHLLPMFGEVSIAYIPGTKIVGLSKLARVVKYFASRLQVQEDFTRELADFLQKKLEAMGVFVIVKARHLCLEMRGARAGNVETVSSAIRGIFETSVPTREEALRLLTT